MKLSVIIVNYNVQHFLEQALISVLDACSNIEAEIFVVDNHSKDDSIKMLKEKFPSVILIPNNQNVGFSRANNQAILRSQGEFVLLLNPDTLVAEDTFIKCIEFMASHPEAGAMGVKMIDGTGAFLPESKRALPTPWVSFCKIFGLSAIFPNSHLFSQYHLGYLSQNQNHEVAVLSGAFMFMRRAALDVSGFLDETFFMYGEDIDLSFRILKANYKNYYFSETTILHYKGESTKKGSINYVKAFYEAMIIYAKKHFSSNSANAYRIIINLAIYIKASFSLVSRLFKNGWLPVFDFFISFLGIYLLKELWENKIMHDDNYYNQTFVFYFIPLYVLTWLLFSFLSGAYDKPIRAINIIKGVGVGTLVLTAVFGLLPNEFRFSRAIILIGALWVALTFFANRLLYQFFNKEEVVFKEEEKHKIIIVGELTEATRVLSLLNETGIWFSFLGVVSPADGVENTEDYIANLSGIEKICLLLNIDEIVFCTKNISAKLIIETMEQIKSTVSYKIILENSNSIVGSNSKNTSGDMYSVDSNLKIGLATERRNKRVFDLGLSLLFLLFLPFYVLVFKIPFSVAMYNLWSVIIGKKTWVGYAQAGPSKYRLPKLRDGVFNLLQDHELLEFSEAFSHKLNLSYAREYSVYNDLLLIWRKINLP